MNHSLHDITFVSIPASQVEWRLLYKDSGSGAKLDGSCWRPIPPIDRLVNIGDTFIIGHDSPSVSTQPINQYVDKQIIQPINQMSVLFAVNRPEVVKKCSNHRLVWSDKGSGAKQDIELYEAVSEPASQSSDQSTDQSSTGWVSLGLFANIDHPDVYLVNESLVCFDGDFDASDSSWTDTGSNTDQHIQTYYNSSYHTFVCTTTAATKVPFVGFRIGGLSKAVDMKLPSCKKYLPNSVVPYEEVKHLFEKPIGGLSDGPAVENTESDKQGDDGQFHQDDFQMV